MEKSKTINKWIWVTSISLITIMLALLISNTRLAKGTFGANTSESGANCNTLSECQRIADSLSGAECPYGAKCVPVSAGSSCYKVECKTMSVDDCSPGYYPANSSCTPCPAGSYCPDGKTKITCPVNTYSAVTRSTSCNACPSGTTTGGKTGQTGKSACTDGSPAATDKCYNCYGTYAWASEDLTISGCNVVSSLTSKSACESNNCTISVSTESIITSVDNDEVQNSYYTVAVSYSGSKCSGQKITYSATNSKTISPTYYDIPAGNDSTGNTRFKVYPASACKPSVATATLTNGKSDSTSAVTILTDWKNYPACEKNPQYTSFEAADAAGANVYYDSFGKCADNVTQAYTRKWVRYGCGDGGGSDSTPPTTNYACYLVDHKYVWASSKPSNGTIVSSISDSSKCKDCENGYILTEEEKCIIPPSDYACYLVDHKYVWSKTKPTGGILVSTITNQSKCTGCENGYSKDSSNNCVEVPPHHISTNPKTGTIALIFAWVVGLCAIVYSIWYFKKTSKR